MENQHKLITGYRDLSQEEINLMNEAKELATKTNLLIEKVSKIGFHEAEIHLNPARSLGIARTELQTGFMWLIRSIAKPQSF